MNLIFGPIFIVGVERWWWSEVVMASEMSLRVPSQVVQNIEGEKLRITSMVILKKNIQSISEHRTWKN